MGCSNHITQSKMCMEYVTFYSKDGIASIDVFVEVLQQHPDWIISQIYAEHLKGKDPNNHTITTELSIDNILDWYDYMNEPICIVDPMHIEGQPKVDKEDGGGEIKNSEHFCKSECTEVHSDQKNLR